MLIVLAMSVAGYFVLRAVNRALRLARLQSKFVAALSQEIRTSLMTMCHLTEFLEHRNAPPERRSECYPALRNESRRLHTIVENLLDFDRTDSPS